MAGALSTAALSLTLLLAACGGDTSSTSPQSGSGGSGGGAGEPVKGGTLIDFQNFSIGPQDHLDPAQASVLQGAQISTLLYDGLTEYDFTNREEPKVKPAVAESYTSNDTSTEWKFTLRKNVTYSDGTPVKASDFKYAWEQVLNPDLASEIAYIVEPIKGAKAVEKGEAKELSGVVADDAAGTLTVTLEEPFAEFDGVLSHPVFSPKPKDAFSKLEKAADWEKQLMIGNGPFKMTKPWSSEDQELVLERNDKYWGGLDNHQAYLDKIVFKVSKDVNSAYTDFEAGNGQTGFIPPGKFKEASDKYPHATEPNLGAYFFSFNMENPQVGGAKNLKLRQAISMGIDRTAINDAVYDGSRRLPSGLTPPGLPGFEKGLCGQYCPATAQVDQAKKLFEEWKSAGNSLSEPIKLNFNAGAGHEDVVNIMIANLKEVGIEAVGDPRDSKTYFSAMRKGDCYVCRAGWIWDYPIYDNGVNAEMKSSSIDGDNLARLNDPALDKDIEDARATKDPDKRAKLYQSAEKRGLDNMAVMPVNWYAGQIVYTDKVANLVETPLQFVLYDSMWLKP